MTDQPTSTQANTGTVRLGLRGRVLVVIVGLLFAAQFVTMIAVLYAAEQGALRQARHDIDVGARVFQAQLAQRHRQMVETVGVLARDFGFKKAVASRDADTIRLALVNQAARIEADLMLLQDVDGPFTATSNATDMPAWSQAALTAALGRRGDANGTFAPTVVVLDGLAYQVVAEPVFAPAHVGWVWAGFIVGDALASEVKALTALDVSFISRTATDEVFGSSLERAAGDRSALAQGAGAAAAPTTLDIGGDSYLTQQLALAGDGTVAALLHVSMTEAMRPYVALRWQLTAVAGVALLLSLLLATKLSHSITQPVQWLLAAARRVGEGNYLHPIEVRRDDELGKLATTFNAMQQGIAERESSILHAASHDALTGLPSRAIVDDRLNSAIARARRNDTSFAVLLMDLNRFKEINDTLGHAVGDDVIVLIAQRLQAAARESDTVARLGGDEFLMLLESCDADDVRETTHRIHESLTDALQIDDLQINVRVSMGLAMYPADGDDAATLLRRADIAMYSAKESQVSLALYRHGQDEEHLHKLSLVADLCRAVEHDLLTLHYQPKVETADGRVTSVEALVRWQHPDHGMIMPDQFITLAEESGNIGMLTDWVLNQSVKQIRCWRDRDIDICVAVNLSALDLLDAQLPARIQDILNRHDIAAGALNLEITESAVMRDAAMANATLRALRALGATISIDDFGTGHSSLAQLKRLPVQVLKIDKSFVMNMADNADDEVIVRSTIELAHNMGLQVVAEGVDNDRSRQMLADWGCETLQGYLLSRPLSAEDFERWLHNYQHSEVA